MLLPGLVSGLLAQTDISYAAFTLPVLPVVRDNAPTGASVFRVFHGDLGRSAVAGQTILEHYSKILF